MLSTLLCVRSAGPVLKILWQLLRAPRPRSGFWGVNSSWVDAEKKRWAAPAVAELPGQHQGQKPGPGPGSSAAVSVSSNDVLTSWFFSTLCGSDVG